MSPLGNLISFKLVYIKEGTFQLLKTSSIISDWLFRMRAMVKAKRSNNKIRFLRSYPRSFSNLAGAVAPVC